MLQGVYALDFVLTTFTEAAKQELVTPTDWESSKLRIHRILASNLPGLVSSFDEFAEALPDFENGSEQRSRTRRFWKNDTSLHLKMPLEADLYPLLPKNCTSPAYPPGHNVLFFPQILQTVVRQETSEAIMYYFHPLLLKMYAKQMPLQLSFLLIHEWLWDLTSDGEVNRRLDYFIHSRQFEAVDEDQFESLLEGE
jgi:hypothetical protein